MISEGNFTYSSAQRHHDNFTDASPSQHLDSLLDKTRGISAAQIHFTW